ncbi:MAG: VOC family protein [Leptolyngbya sp.]|nr:VOC family protein [Candidatus Melainabacteria bacterium]
MNIQGANKTLSPSMLFVGEAYGRAEEAMNFYISMFKNSRIDSIARYEEGESEHDPEGKVKYGYFHLMDQEFIAMDSGYAHAFKFDSGVSFIVDCDTQDEIDAYWKKIGSDGGQEVQCGWITDKFGMCWQVVPKALSKMMCDKDAERRNRVMEVVMEMIKPDLKQLQEAYDGIKASV